MKENDAMSGKKYIIDNAALMAERDWRNNNALEIYPREITIHSGKKSGGSAAKDMSGNHILVAEHYNIQDVLFVDYLYK